MDYQYYFCTESIEKLSDDFFSSFDAHVRAGSREEFIKDIGTAMDSDMLPAFSILLHHAIEINEDILNCSFIPPDRLSPLYFGELSDLIFTEMLKESKASYHLLERLKEIYTSEPNIYVFPPVLKLWRTAVFSENRKYFEIMLYFLSGYDLLKKVLHDYAVIFYLIRNNRRKELSEIAAIIGIDELIGNLNLLPVGIILLDNYPLTFYIEYLFDLFIPEYKYSDDKDRVFCRLFEKYGLLKLLTKSSCSANKFTLIFECMKKGNAAEKKLIRMASIFLHDISEKGYLLSSTDFEDLIVQSDFNFRNRVLCNESVMSELKAIQPSKLRLSYNSKLFSDDHHTYFLKTLAMMQPMQPIIVFDESCPDNNIFSNILHKDLNTVKTIFGSIKTAVDGNAENIRIINEIIERNDSAVTYLLDSLEDTSDEIISSLAQLCVKKGCVTSLSHISKYTAERKGDL